MPNIYFFNEKFLDISNPLKKVKLMNSDGTRTVFSHVIKRHYSSGN